MSKYIALACSQCGRTLNVRTAYLGQWIICNHCEHSFPARGEDDKILSLQLENNRLATTVEVLKSELVERVSELEPLRRAAEDLITVRAERDEGEIERRTLLERNEQLHTRLDELKQVCEGGEAQLVAARRQFEHENDSLRAERDAAIDTLSSELRPEQRQRSQAVERETALLTQVEALRNALDTERHQREAERQEHQEQTTVLAQELNTLFLEQLIDERQHADEAHAAHLREVDELREERDRAREHAEFLLQERDRLAGDLVRLEEQVSALRAERGEVDDAITILHLEAEVNQLRAERDEAMNVISILRAEYDQLLDHYAPLDARLHEAGTETRGEPEQITIEPQPEESRTIPWEAAAPLPSNAPALESADQLEDGDGDGFGVGAEDGKPAVDRIGELRHSLRIAHESRSREPMNQPFFARFSRLWKSSDPVR
jgi:chromosome segregation ATPase